MRGRLAVFAAAAVPLAFALASAKAWTLPRTPDGRPDMQGVWDFRTATPLERPKEYADRQFFTPEEAAQFEQASADRIVSTQTVHPAEWLDYGMRVLPDLRTSLIVDPPDGRVPELTAAARAKAAARGATRRRPAEGPEDLSIGERCLVFGAGPPILPGPYNNNIQIVQTPDTVMVLTEMIHDARVIPVDGRPFPPEHLRGWLGISRGRWDGDTLVVETKQFSDKTSFRGSDEHLRVVERFSRTGPDALRYEYTIDNPTAFTRPWSAAFTMARSDEMMYEFACHEGNYGLLNILKAARYGERAKH